MGSSDTPPPGTPTWLVPASTICIANGVFFWLATYVLMVRRSLATNATPAPLMPLALNLSWEVVYALYVCEAPAEFFGFTMWLLLDLPVLYATLKTAKTSFASAPLVARNVKLLMAIMFLFGLAGNGSFVWWWLKEPHRGYGLKWGKTWKGREARDTTELAFWSAGVAQVAFSVGALAMLLQRGHSGGQSYAIWFCRFFGTVMGLPVTSTLLWWHWPEAHGYIFHPLGFFLIGTTIACDIAYPFVLRHVRLSERVLQDGTVVAGGDNTFESADEKKRL